MSVKSIIYSIIALILFLGIIVGDVFLFRVQIILGIAGILALALPALLSRKAISEASGVFDKVFAKYIVPIVAFVGVVFAILTFTLWL